MTDTDEQEALSHKYVGQTILRLSSGRYAIFTPFSNGRGMRLLDIASWPDIERHIYTETQLHELWKSDHPVSLRPSPKPAAPSASRARLEDI